MTDLKLADAHGGERIVPNKDVERFTRQFVGEVLRPADRGYDEARRVWNGMVNKRPGLIARCTGAADVIAAVNFSRDNSLLASVRGGGHNVAGFAVSDGGLMIDLSRMKGIRVHPASRVARAEPGLTWGEFDRQTQAFGLATTGGFVPSTGIAGLTLGGGIGYLVRRFGLACDNLLSVDIVTADGQLRTASTTENEDLFWGVRGGGGNFGIVTSFEYRLHPVGPLVLGGLLFHPISEARGILRFYHEFAPSAPDDLVVHYLLVTSPEGQPAVAFIVCYSGPMEKADAVIRPLRQCGSLMADMVRPASYTDVQAIGGEMLPAGRQNYWKSSFIYELSDEAIDTMITQFEGVPSPFSVAALEPLGGAMSRIGPDETAFGDRGALYSLIVAASWTNRAENDKNIQWARGFWEAMRPYESDAAYINYLDADEQHRIKDVYGRKYERLVALKNKYDPTNLFRLNQNIKPTV